LCDGGQMSFQVPAELMEQAAGKVNVRADAVGAVNLAGLADRVSAAMPGGAAADQARAAGDSWRSTLSAWAADGHEYAKDLADSAKTYEGVEQSNKSSFAGRALRGVN